MYALSQKIVQLVEEMYAVGAASAIPWMNPETRLKEKKKEARFLLLKKMQRKKAAIEGMYLFLIPKSSPVGAPNHRPTSNAKYQLAYFSLSISDCSSELSTLRTHRVFKSIYLE
jgi:hypothetical protein